MNSHASTTVLAAALLLTGCFAASKPPPPKITGSALAIPPVGNVAPLYLYIAADGELSINIDREKIEGVMSDSRKVRVLTSEEAGNEAGGIDPLLARLSDEGEVAHVAKRAGAVFGGSSLTGLYAGCVGGSGGGPPLAALMCAAGGALGTAVGLVGAVGVGTYLGVSEHARKIGMLDDISLAPQSSSSSSYQGYVFLPVGTYQALQVPVEDPRTKDIQAVAVAVAPGFLGSPGEHPAPAR